jgi:hypothetical protein
MLQMPAERCVQNSTNAHKDNEHLSVSVQRQKRGGEKNDI